MDTLELIHSQLALECIGFNAQGLLVRIPGPDPDELSRVYVYQVNGSYQLYFRADLSQPVLEKMRALGGQTAFNIPETVCAILGTEGACQGIFHGQTYVIDRLIDPGESPDAVRLSGEQRAMIDDYQAGMEVARKVAYAIIREGRIVATCTSSRENHVAGEAYVHTLPEYRRRGYGVQVTAAWANHLLCAGKIPFYSHALDNLGSHGIMRTLKFEPTFRIVTYS